MKENKNKTFNFYGIRKTANENYYSVTLCSGKGENREWVNVPVKKELVKFSAKENAYYVKLKPLEEKHENKQKQEKKDDLPF